MCGAGVGDAAGDAVGVAVGEGVASCAIATSDNEKRQSRSLVNRPMFFIDIISG